MEKRGKQGIDQLVLAQKLFRLEELKQEITAAQENCQAGKPHAYFDGGADVF
jgi:hypothetical protein